MKSKASQASSSSCVCCVESVQASSGHARVSAWLSDVVQILCKMDASDVYDGMHAP